jgi:(1->4)-alpha-D-glucan 1-alpha-D-glucosylmutase
VARLGMVSSLAQTLLKIAAPGVPDFYQGAELWDFSLVDPDNRRPVDFALRRGLLAELRAKIAGGDLAQLCRELMEEWQDGRIKLYVTHRALDYRRRFPELFGSGAYLPLRTEGPAAEHLVAFARRHGPEVVVAVAPRLLADLTDSGLRPPLGDLVWRDTTVLLPAEFAAGPYRDLLTGHHVTPRPTPDSCALPIAELLAVFPVALLVAVADDREDGR